MREQLLAQMGNAQRSDFLRLWRDYNLVQAFAGRVWYDEIYNTDPRWRDSMLSLASVNNEIISAKLKRNEEKRKSGLVNPEGGALFEDEDLEDISLWDASRWGQPVPGESQDGGATTA